MTNPILSAQEEIRKLEAEMDSLIAKGNRSRFIKLTFGNVAFQFKGGLADLARFLQESGLNVLERYISMDTCYTYDTEGLNNKYTSTIHYTEQQDIELVADISIVEEVILSKVDALKMESLQKKYMAAGKLYKTLLSAEPTGESNAQVPF